MSPAAALRLARTIIDAAGQPIPDHQELIRVPWSVRTIATHADISAGTAQKYLKILDDLEVRLDAETRLFSLTRLNELATQVTATPPNQPTAPRTPAPATNDTTLPTDPAAGFAALCQLVAADQAQLPVAEATALEWLRRFAQPSPTGTRPPTPSPELRNTPHNSAAETARAARQQANAGRAAESRATTAELDRAISDLDELMNESIPSSVESDRARATSDESSRSAQELVALLAPLTEACERLALPGVSDSRELNRRLSCFDDNQVRYAVNKLLVEANNGLRKPVGKLANVAGDQSLDYFPVNPPAVRLPGESAAPTDSAHEAIDSPDELIVPVPPADLAVSREGLTKVRESLDSLRYVEGSN